MPIDVTWFANNGVPVDRDVQSAVIRQAPELRFRAPLIAMLIAGGSSLAMETKTEKFEYATRGQLARVTQVNNAGAAYTNATTAIVVDDVANFPPGGLIRADATREIMLVQGRNSGTQTLTVVRGIGSGSGGVAAHANSVADNAYFTFIGFAAGEGAGLLTDTPHAQTLVDNLTQEFVRAVEITGAADSQATLTGRSREEEIVAQYEEFLDDLERAAYFGSKNSTALDASGRRVTTTQGVYNFVSTNRFLIGAAMTKTYFIDTVLNQINPGSGVKDVIGGDTFLSTIDRLFEAELRRDVAVNTTSRFVRELHTRKGIVRFHPSMAFGANFNGDAVILDMARGVKIRHQPQQAVGKRQANDGMPMLFRDLEDNGATAKKDEWRAKIGFQWGDQLSHGLILGVTGPG